MGQKQVKNSGEKWHRPETIEYPKLWHIFKAKDVNSNKMVEYRIEDLPESRFGDAISTMVQYFCSQEPLSKAYGIPQLNF